MPIDAVLGAQWGDEGKGKDVSADAHKYEIVARFNGGNNAGHTVVINKQVYKLHMMPSGILTANVMNVIGPGCVVNLKEFKQEIETLQSQGVKISSKNLVISTRAGIVLQCHQIADGKNESALGDKKLGTTGRGIGPAYSDRARRIAPVMGDCSNAEQFHQRASRTYQSYNLDYDPSEYEELLQFYSEFLGDTTEYLSDALNKGTEILAEGANALMLDHYHGSYPYVTSSDTTAGGICVGLGVPPTAIRNVYGIVKAYCTRVGEGPFPTEQNNPNGETLQKNGHEFGTTTNRPRRCGWLDLVQLKYSNDINGYTEITVTKLDVLDTFDSIPVCTMYKTGVSPLDPQAVLDLDARSCITPMYTRLPGWKTPTTHITKWEDLPEQARQYIRFIEKESGIRVRRIGVGPGQDALITVPPLSSRRSPPRTLTFVTTNPNKYSSAKRLLPDINLEHCNTELEEFQSDITSIVSFKAEQAFKFVESPVIVEDTSFSVMNSPNGLPGVYVKHFLKDGIAQFYKMCYDGFSSPSPSDKKVSVTVCFAIMSSSGLKIFSHTCEGYLVSPRGENGFGWDKVFAPIHPANPNRLSYAELDASWKDQYGCRALALKKVRDYFSH